eukprot:650458-Hanusia_phi.AAC.1
MPLLHWDSPGPGRAGTPGRQENFGRTPGSESAGRVSLRLITVPEIEHCGPYNLALGQPVLVRFPWHAM